MPTFPNAAPNYGYRFSQAGAPNRVPAAQRRQSWWAGSFAWTKQAVPVGYVMDGFQLPLSSLGFSGWTIPNGSNSSLAGSVVGLGVLVSAVDGVGSVPAAALARGKPLVGTLAGLGNVLAAVYGRGPIGATIRIAFQPSADETADAIVAKPLVGLGMTVGEAMALTLRLLRNKTITDPVSGTQRVYADDDDTTLVEAPLYADADGATPYSGSGAERRDRFA